jgi:uncharacterized SAM-binding protein YcdF (DUF218 family)
MERMAVKTIIIYSQDVCAALNCLKKLKTFFSVLLLVLLVSSCSSFNRQGLSVTEIRNQSAADEYIQDGIYYFWNGGDIAKAEKKYFKGITLRGNLPVVEKCYEKALELAPYRLDLRFDIASTEILQTKTSEALDTYNEILKIDPVNFNALYLSGIYSKIAGYNDIYVNNISKLKELYPEKSGKYVSAINRTDKILNTDINTVPKELNLKNHVIVILGYALADDGTPKPTLIERMKKTFAAYNLNPESKIIASGGMPHGGVTESFVIKEWLVDHGVPEEQILIEDNSKDTVGNAFYSTKILEKLKAQSVTIVTSASHIRRALAVFTEASKRRGLSISFGNLVYMDYPDMKAAEMVTDKEKLVIFRDMARAAGIWAYPGVQM